MPKVVVVVGLPGSGKSTWLEPVKSTTPDIIIMDDIESPDDLPEELTCDIYLTSPIFCTNYWHVVGFLQSIYPDTEIELVFFENDPEAAIANVHRRNDGRIVSDSYIRFLSDQYQIPEGIQILPIWKPVID